MTTKLTEKLQKCCIQSDEQPIRMDRMPYFIDEGKLLSLPVILKRIVSFETHNQTHFAFYGFC